ncbi:Arylesterase [Roseovarius albus]|uniref:Arylesterase n=1 Tax=Roseovarius albus TaxID=1247867 RepID=A0A1X6ZNY3_9RHOB|nr:alpha/beta hydrolase [Roseovarius albus]SLN56772.1 Arylesterase [Roseovarius albus]
MIWGLVLLATIVAWPFAREALRSRMNAKRRQDAPGQFAQLSRGVVHCQWLGAETGPLIVCVHGLTTPSFVFGPMAMGLGKLGYRVLVYDHYGRGYSDRPGGIQDSDFFCETLTELLQDQDIDTPFTLLGYSMGGGIVAAFSARFPERIKRLILLAPIGMGHDLGPIVRMASNYEFFGRWMLMVMYPRMLRRGVEAERGLQGDIEGVVDLQINEMKTKGFLPGVINSLRGICDEILEEDHRAIHSANIPVHAIWGETDDIIPVSGAEKLSDWNPDAMHKIIEGADHTLAYTATQAVVNAIPSAD